MDLHPEKLILSLNTYFENVPLSLSQQLTLAQHQLTGDDKILNELLILLPGTYLEFRILFRKRFWLSATQRKVRNDIRLHQYNRYEVFATGVMQCIV